MNLLDLIVVVILILGAYRGWKYGGFSAAISLFGSLLVFVLAYYLKDPIAELMYINLPFRAFGGIFAGISSFNILVYEGIAYLICMIILASILNIILKITGIVDKLINLTLVFALPSKILGMLLGALKYFIYVFVGLFVLSALPFSAKYFNESTISIGIVHKTPLLSNVTQDLYKSVSEVYDICSSFTSEEKEKQGDAKSLDSLLKNKIITVESVKKLKEKGKLNFEGLDEVIEKYEKLGEKND